MSTRMVLGNLNREMRLDNRPDIEITTVELTGEKEKLTVGVALCLSAELAAPTDERGNVLEKSQHTLIAAELWRQLWSAFKSKADHIIVTKEELEVLRARAHRRFPNPQMFAILDEEIEVAKTMTEESFLKKKEAPAEKEGGDE